MVGYAFMGAAHSQAWRTAGRFFDLPLQPDMAVLCGRDADGRRRGRAAAGLAARPRPTGSALLARDDVQLVDICTPGDTHAEIAIAALDAGKHVLCEKPLANTVDEARAMVAAAERGAGQGRALHGGFNYRRVPAVALARRLVEQGRIGEIRHVRAAVPAGLDRRPGVPAGLAAAEGQGRLRARWATSARTSSTWPSSSPATGSPGSPR